MSMNMTQQERDTFLQEVHVGVIAIEIPNSAPLSAPIWYDYSPEDGLWILTSATSKKGKALEAAGRFTLVAQCETPPLYKYVSVSGNIVERRPATESELSCMAHRYFDEKTAAVYLQSSADSESTCYRMQPQKWLTLDYGKLQQTPA